MSLEIGSAAYSVTPDGGGGVVTPDVAGRTAVQLIGVDDCRLYTEFEITPGAAVAIRFAPDGTVSVEDHAGGALEMGPGLVEREQTDCAASAFSL